MPSVTPNARYTLYPIPNTHSKSGAYANENISPGIQRKRLVPAQEARVLRVCRVSHPHVHVHGVMEQRGFESGADIYERERIRNKVQIVWVLLLGVVLDAQAHVSVTE